MVAPEDMWALIDFGRLHPEFHNLRRKCVRRRLWEHGAPFHAILPTRKRSPYIDSAFVTFPHELPEELRVPYPTMSIFWMEDPAWHNLARLAKRFNTHSLLGVSSLNTHGEEPPYTYAELIAQMEHKPEWDFDIIVVDEIAEAAEIKSSHTQIRFPSCHDPPECVVVRIGSLSPEGFHKLTDLSVRVHEQVRLAARGHPADAVLDDRVQWAIDCARDLYSRSAKGGPLGTVRG